MGFTDFVEGHYLTRPAHPVRNDSDYARLPHTRWALRWIGTGQRVLDLGCHKGDIGAVIQNAGNKVIGVDYPSLTQKAAEEKGITVVSHDLNKPLPFKDGEFDAVLALSILDYLPDDLAFLKECRRVLRPGGVIVVGVPNAVSLFNRLAVLTGRTGRNFGDLTGYHTLNYYTRDGISKLLSMSGFSVQTVKKAPKASSRIPFRSLLERVLPVTFATDILLQAK